MSRIFGVFVVLVASFFLYQNKDLYFESDTVSFREDKEKESPTYSSKDLLEKDYEEFDEIKTKLPKGGSFYEAMIKRGLSHRVILDFVDKAKPFFNLKDISPGTPVNFFLSKGILQKIRIIPRITQELVFTKNKDSWVFSNNILPIKVERIFFSGNIKASLWESAVESNLSSKVIEEFTNIFSWQIDFSRELRKGASWALLVEKKKVNDKEIGFGNILVAQLLNQKNKMLAVRFKDKGKVDYYDLSGRNLRGKFLRSPVKFSRISSKFQRRRFHPILKVNRPHLGVDYAAKSGTPVRAVGDAKVLFAGWNGKSGKTVRLRHGSRFKTAYKHLSRIPRGLRKGSSVNQGQVIGYVGRTGLATGPHLHFEFFERGRYVDPLGIRFPRERSISKSNKQKYLNYSQQLYSFLNSEINNIALKNESASEVSL